MPSILVKYSGPLTTVIKRLQLRPRFRLCLPLGINDLLHAGEGLVNPLRDGPLARSSSDLWYGAAILVACLISQSASSSAASADAPYRSMRRAYREPSGGVVRVRYSIVL